MATIKLGRDCKLYIGTAGTQAATLVGNVRDVTLNMTRAPVDASARESNDWEEVVVGMKATSVSFQMRTKVTADTNMTTLETAYIDGTPVAALVLDGLKTAPGARGLDADVVVTAFNRGQPLNGWVTADITIQPTPSTRAPAWFIAT